MTDELYALDLRDEVDVFTSRHTGREVAAALGFEGQDVAQVATSLSEVSREVLAAGGGRVSFHLESADSLHVVITGERGVDAFAAQTSGAGIDAAKTLMDDVTVTADEAGHAVIVLTKRLRRSQVPDEELRRDLLQRLPAQVVRSSLDELHTQNRELVAAYEEVRAQRDQLELVNAELTETNAGVLALYDELSGELETTNQGVVALYAEIDDKSRQLREASESKTRFLNNISHELRTPGNSVLGLSRLLLDPDADPLTDEQRHQVGFIATSAEDLLRLVNELLDLAKAESGRLDAVWDTFDLGLLFEELQGTTSPLVTRDAVSLVVEPPVDLDRVHSDRTLLRHILRNLLSNAVKFTYEGSVTMSAVRDGGLFRVTVRDTGVGIAPEDQPRVFEEFYQVRGSHQKGHSGSGLGLPFARRLSQVLGGDLHLESVPGEGTTFILELPVEPTP